MASRRVPQMFDYFLVLDFEATCQEGARITPQEVIEFPVLKVNGSSFETEAIFHQYVKPEVHTELSPFCTQLTGIIQDMVEGQPNIRETLTSLDAWMDKEGLKEESVKTVFVTCGDWDLNVMLPGQAEHFKLKYPTYLKRWINIKKPYAKTVGKYPKGLNTMLTGLNMKFEGRPHSGIDDCKNIARVLRGLAERGCLFQMTGNLAETFGGGDSQAMTMEVPSHLVGRIIGKGGSHIRELQDQSGCRIHLRKEGGSAGNAVIALTGSAAVQAKAKQLIEQTCQEAST